MGTSKQASTAVVDEDHPAEALIAGLNAGDSEHLFLLRSGLRAVYEQCGQSALQGLEATQPSSEEDRHYGGQKLIGPLQNAMASDSFDLLVEFLRQLDGSRLLLPPELLPAALSMSDANVREHLLPVLGNRGRWLSAFNPEWRWVTEGIGALSERDLDAVFQQWEVGAIAERCRALRAMRHSNPAEARNRLSEVIGSEKAEHRVRLVAACAIGLSEDDEPFLDSLLDDRSDKVRRESATLLSRISSSELATRMLERADAMLTAHASGIVRKNLTLVCRPPEAIDKVWERDGIPKRAPAGRGKRAVWTEIVLESVAPSHWSTRFETQPERLVEAILEDDFSTPVLVGWTRACEAFSGLDEGVVPWLQPLWDHWLRIHQRSRDEKGKRAALEHLRSLLRSMPNGEDALSPVFKTAKTGADPDLLGLLSLLPRPWSEAFGTRYLSTMRSALQRQPQHAYHWAQTLFTAGRALPRETFDAALEPWHAGTDGNWHSQAVSREIEKFTDTIRTRKSFFDEVVEP